MYKHSYTSCCFSHKLMSNIDQREVIKFEIKDKIEKARKLNHLKTNKFLIEIVTSVRLIDQEAFMNYVDNSLVDMTDYKDYKEYVERILKKFNEDDRYVIVVIIPEIKETQTDDKIIETILAKSSTVMSNLLHK